MAKEQRLIDLWGVNMEEVDTSDCTDVEDILSAVITYLSELPTVDAVKLPNGKPGDYVKWTNGVSERLFEISSIVICKDGMRYDLGDFCPFVNHPNILEIMSREEAERWMQDGKRK